MGKDIWLFGEFPVVNFVKGIDEFSCMCELWEKTINAFIMGMYEHQKFLLEQRYIETIIRNNTILLPKVRSSEEIVITNSEFSKRCVLCMKTLQQGERCLKLKCGHYFHKMEIIDYFHCNDKQCPLCKRKCET